MKRREFTSGLIGSWVASAAFAPLAHTVFFITIITENNSCSSSAPAC